MSCEAEDSRRRRSRVTVFRRAESADAGGEDPQICSMSRAVLTGRFMYKGPEEVVHDSVECLGTEVCGRCITRCMFGANREEPDGTVSLDIEKCYGCGLCVDTCLGQARTMRVRADYRHERLVSSKILLSQEGV